MSVLRMASALVLTVAASAAHADCDLRFAPPEVRASANAHRIRLNGNPLMNPAATFSPFEKGGPKGDLLFGPEHEKEILPNPPFSKEGEQRNRTSDDIMPSTE